MDEHRPDGAPDDLTQLGHVDDAAGVVAAIGAEDDLVHDPAPADDPQPSWIPEPDDAPPDPSDIDAGGQDAWVGEAHGPAIADPSGIHDADPVGGPEDALEAGPIGVQDAQPAHAIGNFDSPIELPVARADGAALPQADDSLPGLTPPDDGDSASWEHRGAIADPLDDIRAYDEAGGDEGDHIELLLGSDLDADGDADLGVTENGTVLRFDDGFDVDDLSDQNGGWSAAAVVSAIGVAGVVGAGALAHRLTRKRGFERGSVAAVEELDAVGLEARVEHGDLLQLEAALAGGDRVLISHVFGSANGSDWNERALVVCEIDRRGQQVLLAPADLDGSAGIAGTALTSAPSLRMPLGTFVGSWADSAGEMVVVDATSDAPRSLVLPVAVSDTLLRPVEDSS